ncbi:MAG: calcium-translocating P-type ATPase, PMCA-type [Clostridia bacterium]|jgi:calcium-translocating P-type ATPase, PMCA-type|nr:calcium-translocating P-type ATPase, PMCA-type [Clostridia bacterium]
MWYTLSTKEVEKQMQTNIEFGLNEKQVKDKQNRFGLNKLEEKKKESIVIKFIKQFNDFMIIILIIASIISAVVARLEGSNDYFDSIIIIAIVVFNAIMGLVQEAKAEKSLEALKKMTAPTCRVKRNGKISTIKSEQIVPGDIVLLEAGNYVPADCRLISSSNLKIEESSLTGETVPVLKDANCMLKEITALGDMVNMAFSTTIVVNGHGEAIVTDIGMNTKVGKIAKMIITNEAPETPIQKKLEEVGKALGIACLGICLLIFVIGILKKIEPIEMFMTSVGLAVAAIPEGLPAIVTIMLSIGVTKMAKKNSIIRKLPAVETLGSSSVICSDKTGTLTQNKMQVTKIANINGETNDKEYIKWLMGMATMCTDVEISKENGKMELTGEPTEKAIVSKALDEGQNKNELYNVMKRVKDIPFDSSRKMMTTIHKMPNGYRVITKGAPDVLLKRCNKVYDNGNVTTLDYSKTKLIENQNNKMADEALRVLAIAYLDIPSLPSRIDTETVEKNLIFIGLIGMIDPPREGVKEAVATCKKAGIKTVMITGDHIITAKAIAKDLGILRGSDLAITGEELDKIPQSILQKNIMNYSVFARVTPEHKVRIVKAYQSTDAVVAMTGDGVNDAPALKNADIGIAMGKNGTDVAKNAADMVLTDDNFVTIVEAVKQGRNIFDNIKKAVHFLIATNIGEIVTIFLGLVLGLKSPLLAIQLLWINLVTDSLPAIALGLEKPEADIMDKKPRDSKKGIFADGLWQRIITEGTMLGILTLVAFSVGNYLYDIEVGRTMAFVSLGLLELVHSFNIKSEESIFKVGLFENKYLMGAFILGVILQIVVVVIPSVAEVFKLVPLTQVQWMYTFGISILPLVIMEIQKAFNKIEPSTMQIKYSMQNSIAQKNK